VGGRVRSGHGDGPASCESPLSPASQGLRAERITIGLACRTFSRKRSSPGSAPRDRDLGTGIHRCLAVGVGQVSVPVKPRREYAQYEATPLVLRGVWPQTLDNPMQDGTGDGAGAHCPAAVRRHP
jgi:hypothetical protein